MRGRKPRPFFLHTADLPRLHQVGDSRSLPFATVQHARIVLAVADGQRIQDVARLHECDPATVWRLCRRYEQGGLPRLLDDLPRSGCPQRISPLQRAQIVELACLEPIAEGLHITHWTSADLARQAVADGIQSRSGTPHLAVRRSATAPHALLADSPIGPPVRAARRESPVVLRQRRPSGPAGHLGRLCR